MKIAFVPIDNRPVCYTLPKMIAEVDSSIEFLIPPRELLGNLSHNANIQALFEWFEELPKQDVIILSLDTLVYGGLIPSRRCPESFEEIKQRALRLKNILETKDAKILATSSIMRISNNNYNEEEKDYWAEYGKNIFQYSFEMSRDGATSVNLPEEILKDYLQTRKRNFEINKMYLEWGIFDTLVFSKDDCAQYGFNVDEAHELERLGGFCKTGADEIPLSLLSRAIGGDLKICPIFLEPEYKNLVSNYEDVSIEKSVWGQIELAGCSVVPECEADILLYVNNFIDHQGEIVMKIGTEKFTGNFVAPEKPYMIADVRFANGADNNFVDALLKNNLMSGNFYGYSAWNTSANSLGSLICAAKVKFFAECIDDVNFKKLQITRFLDDWAYQANVRQTLTNLTVPPMENFEQIILKAFGVKFGIEYTFPWNRLFEIEVGIKS